MRPGPLCMLLHCLLLPSGEPSACEAKEGGQEERSFPKTGWSFLINYIFHIAFYMAEERLMTFFVLNLTSCWNVMLHISTQTARWRLTPTSPLNVHQSQRETWLLPFKFKFFRKSITLSIIHKSTYKEVAKPNKENLCILLTCILQLIQDFISRGVKKKTNPNWDRNAIADDSRFNKNSAADICAAVLWMLWRDAHKQKKREGYFPLKSNGRWPDFSMLREFFKLHIDLQFVFVLTVQLPHTLYVEKLSSTNWHHFKPSRVKAWF